MQQTLKTVRHACALGVDMNLFSFLFSGTIPIACPVTPLVPGVFGTKAMKVIKRRLGP